MASVDPRLFGRDTRRTMDLKGLIDAQVRPAPRLFQGPPPRKSPPLSRFRRRRRRSQRIGCCVGMSGAAMCETTVQTPDPLRPESVPTGLSVDFSDLWTYYIARAETAKADGSIYRGEGAVVSHALLAVIEHGMIAHDAWPSEPSGYEGYYKIERSGKLPDTVASAERHRPLGEARRLTDPDQILEYLAGGYSVWIGIPWSEAAMSTRVDRAGGPPRFSFGGPTVGGHAVEVLAYDLDEDWADVGNSWEDAGWGDESGVGRTSLRGLLSLLSARAMASGQSEAVVAAEVAGNWHPKAKPIDWADVLNRI